MQCSKLLSRAYSARIDRRARSPMQSPSGRELYLGGEKCRPFVPYRGFWPLLFDWAMLHCVRLLRRRFTEQIVCHRCGENEIYSAFRVCAGIGIMSPIPVQSPVAATFAQPLYRVRAAYFRQRVPPISPALITTCGEIQVSWPDRSESSVHAIY
jgi:hypothetical protein